MMLRVKKVYQNLLALLLASTVIALQVGAQNAPALSSAEQSLTKDISVQAIEKYTVALAADEMEGRGTMQPGGEKAAQWLAEQMKALGLKPLGENGTYLQAVPLTETLIAPETSFLLDGQPLALGADWAPLAQSLKDIEYSGPLVFAGHALKSEALKRNDIKDADLKGRIVLLIAGRPVNVSEEAWSKSNGLLQAIGSAFRNGARAVVLINNGLEKHSSEFYIDYMVRRQISAGQGQTPPPILYAGNAGAEKLFARSGVTLKDAVAQAESEDFKPIDLKANAEVRVKVKVSQGEGKNVIGYLEGSDPVLKSEAVFFTAHYDAYGLLNGKVYNGAADNALGNAEMLAVAGAFAKMKVKPKRSLVFMSVTGEEHGLLGSKRWVANPTWDLQKIAAVLNLDGIGTEVFGPVKNIVGYGAEFSSLGPMLHDTAKVYGINVMPDPVPSEGVFKRSDHYSFVERGIPALMLMGAPEGDKEAIVKQIYAWMEVNYHQPSDDVYQTWHWEGAKAVADIMGLIGLRVAQQPELPEWFPDSPYGKLKRGARLGATGN
jgi:hypothetical protein